MLTSLQEFPNGSWLNSTAKRVSFQRARPDNIQDSMDLGLANVVHDSMELSSGSTTQLFKALTCGTCMWSRGNSLTHELAEDIKIIIKLV